MGALRCCWCRLLGRHCCSVSCFPSPFFPSPTFLLRLLWSSSYFCWQSSFRPFLRLWPLLVNSCPLQSQLMRSLKSSGVCFYSEQCHELLEWLRASPASLVPHSWSCCLSEWVCCPSLWVRLEVTKEEHLIASTIAISLYLFPFPAARTHHYFFIFPAVKKKYLSFLRPWFVLCPEPLLLRETHNTGNLSHLICLYLLPCKDKSWFHLHRNITDKMCDHNPQYRKLLRFNSMSSLMKTSWTFRQVMASIYQSSQVGFAMSEELFVQ